MEAASQNQQKQLPFFSSFFSKIVPFFLSALLFLTAFFTLFSPFPLLAFYFQGNTSLALVVCAALVNAAIVGFLGGPLSSGLYLTLIFPIVVFMPLYLEWSVKKQKMTLEKTVFFTLLVVIFSGAGLVGAYSLIQKINPWILFQDQVGLIVEQLKTWSGGSGADWEVPPEALKKSLMVELPSGFLVFALLTVSANLVMLLRMNPKGLMARSGLNPLFLKLWKAPAYLVWPAILAGATQVLPIPETQAWISAIGLNVFKVLMAVYGLQGLSVLSFLFARWKVPNLLKLLLFTLFVAFLTPLLLAVGFFDLWFDFRAKFRQS